MGDQPPKLLRARYRGYRNGQASQRAAIGAVARPELFLAWRAGSSFIFHKIVVDYSQSFVFFGIFSFRACYRFRSWSIPHLAKVATFQQPLWRCTHFPSNFSEPAQPILQRSLQEGTEGLLRTRMRREVVVHPCVHRSADRLENARYFFFCDWVRLLFSGSLRFSLS